jgi:hypothetical protein
MNISLQLEKAGLNKAAQSLGFRVELLRSSGIECDEASVLTTNERDQFRLIKCQMRLAKVSTYAELEEHGRLVNLLLRTTSESRAWLSTLPLLRLQAMMDAVEQSW